jgi:hypothetical protein
MNHQTEEAKYHDDYNNDHTGTYPTDTHYPEDGNYHYDDATNTYHDGSGDAYHGNTTAAVGMDCKDYCEMEMSYMKFSSEDAGIEFMKECNTQCKKDS